MNAEAPVLNLVARVLGVKTDERNWRVGAKGEEKVAGQLAKLGDGWHRIHAVPVGENGSDIDHVAIGPPGVFTLNAKRHPRGAVVDARDQVVHFAEPLAGSQARPGEGRTSQGAGLRFGRRRPVPRQA